MITKSDIDDMRTWSKTEWISVKDKLPPDDYPVLILYFPFSGLMARDGIRSVAIIENNVWYSPYANILDDEDNVSYWCEMPSKDGLTPIK